MTLVAASSLALAEDHWAYQAPVRPSVPSVADEKWPRGAIDRFVLRRLEREDLEPSPQADRYTLIRRLSLDLTGLPPSVEEVDRFIADERPEAYEKLVDRLLASPAYGERFASRWLDLARYADSNGFQRDGHRSSWPYRDWVVTALNDDLPFDEFTIDQLAGDLLPGATLESTIATGFHRNTTVNVEAGVDREEDRLNAVFDRVNTTGTVWLGSTLSCAQCHDHKYDPFTQEDYYGLLAYFNQTEIETKAEGGSVRQFIGPKIELPLAEEKRIARRELDAKRETLERELKALRAERKSWEENLAANAAELAAEPKPIRAIFRIDAKDRTAKQKKKLLERFRAVKPRFAECESEIATVRERLDELAPPTALVMRERADTRETRVLRRGSFLDPADPVAPGVPSALHPLAEDAPANRLGLARWLASPENPLVARVVVNRHWAAFFGRGLVATPEDFGTRGARPTHPELLDWLACELVDSGWSVKRVHRAMVLSAAYQQSSRVSAIAKERDPDNELYARGARFRLEAERIRDAALAASGTLARRLGGPPVYPPQPDGTWVVIGVVDNTYRTSTGEDRYRRGLYTVLRRSSPYPSFVAFDAPDRTATCVERPRTNTPLQALVLLNDPVYVDLAFKLAERVIADLPNGSSADRVRYAFRRCLSRPPSASELRRMVELFETELSRLRAQPNAARALLEGRSVPADTPHPELAAAFFVASVLLNLDETISRE